MKNVIAGIVLAAALIVALAYWLRRRHICRGWQSWPTAQATVEAAEVRALKGNFFVEIGYSYAVNGSYKTGWHAMSCSGQAEAEDYAASIRGQKVIIRFNPNNPECSRLDQEPISLS